MKNRSRSTPYIVLSVIALIFIVALIVGWNLIFPFYFTARFETNDSTSSKVLLWLIMGLGDIFLVTIIVAVLVTMFAIIRRSQHIHRQNTFLDTISHELKTPITSLQLCLDTLHRHQLSDEKRTHFLLRMGNDLTRLQRCINQVLEANKLEHGERILTCVQTPIYDIIYHCAQRIRERYELTDSAISIEGIEKDYCVLLDAVAFETILLNFLDNAVKYSPHEKSISVRLSTLNDRDCLRISDTGLGLPSKDIKKLFKRFSRLQNGHSIPGTGLGLHLVDNLATRMGMQVQAENHEAASGSTFSLIFAKNSCAVL